MSDDLFGPDPGFRKADPHRDDDDLFQPEEDLFQPGKDPVLPEESERARSGPPRVLLALGALLAVIVGIVLVFSRGQSEPESPAAGPVTAPSPSGTPSDAPGNGGTTAPRSSPSTQPRTPTTGLVVDIPSAREAVESLPVKGRAPKTGYDRERFGSPWEDVDGNGCDTRNDILRRDLVDITLRDDCIVESGTLVDPFSLATIPFQRGFATSAEVQIDHLVSLSNAWQTGAQQLSQSQRVALANDPGNLLAVRGDLNAQKGDGDAATWLPPNKSFRCQYVAMQVLVKERHGLWLTAPEKAAMQRILQRC